MTRRHRTLRYLASRTAAIYAKMDQHHRCKEEAGATKQQMKISTMTLTNEERVEYGNYSPTGETGGDYRFALCLSVTLSVTLVILSVCHTSFPDFSWLYFHISKWKLVAIFYMKSYRSSFTCFTVDLLFHELLPFVQNSFSGFFLVMLSHIWMKVGSKLPYEELQIKFHFHHSWTTF